MRATLTLVCAAILMASGLTAVLEAVLLGREANALSNAPVCGSSHPRGDCRLLLAGTVAGGYDEVSGLTPERHVDVMAASGHVQHLTSPIVGTAPRVGSAVTLEYWKGSLVRFATTAGTVMTASHPGELSRTFRLLAWFAFGLAVLFWIWFASGFRHGRELPRAYTASESAIGVSHWFYVGIGVVIVVIGFADLAADGFSEPVLASGLKSGGLVALGLSLVILSAIGRRVTITPDGLLYLRRFVIFPAITRVKLEPGRNPFSGLRIVTIQARNNEKPLAIDTKYFGWVNRVRLLQTIANRASEAEFDAEAAALTEGRTAVRENRAAGADPWQGQNRGCATAMLGVGSVLLVLGLVFATLGGPEIGGLWIFAVGAIFVGVGIHRNIKVLRAYFGRPRGDLLFLLQTLGPIAAWCIDAAGETSSNGSTRLLFRFLSLLPFVAIWILVWVPLAKAAESMGDQTRTA